MSLGKRLIRLHIFILTASTLRFRAIPFRLGFCVSRYFWHRAQNCRHIRIFFYFFRNGCCEIDILCAQTNRVRKKLRPYGYFNKLTCFDSSSVKFINGIWSKVANKCYSNQNHSSFIYNDLLNTWLQLDLNYCLIIESYFWFECVFNCKDIEFCHHHVIKTQDLKFRKGVLNS